jgi:hypothetical protein
METGFLALFWTWTIGFIWFPYLIGRNAGIVCKAFKHALMEKENE